MSDEAQTSATQAKKIPDVFTLISSITKELSIIGISKSGENKKQGYKFRGIDQVYNALSPLLAKYGLNILPSVQERAERIVKSQAGNDLNYVVLKVDYYFIAASDASLWKVTTYGEGMDSADKATNKALSAAYKYAIIQAFAIPVEGQPDADAETATADAPELTDEQVEALRARLKTNRMSEAKVLEFAEVDSLKKLTPANLQVLEAQFKKKEATASATEPSKG